MKDIFKNASPALKISMIIFLIVVGLSIFIVLGILLSALIFQVDIKYVMSSFESLKKEDVNILKFLQSMYSIGLFVFPSIVGAWLFGDKIFTYLRLNIQPKFLNICLAMIIILSIAPLINLIVEWNENISFPESMQAIENWMKQMENDAKKTTDLFLKADSFITYLSNVLVLALIPAIGEELLFRGVLQKIFYNWSNKIHIAIWLSAFLFSALHMQFYGFIPRMILGALFGYLFFWSGNLWIPITTHFINNLMAVTLYYTNSNTGKKLESIGKGDNEYTYIVISIFLFSFLLFYFYKININKGTKGNSIIDL